MLPKIPSTHQTRWFRPSKLIQPADAKNLAQAS